MLDLIRHFLFFNPCQRWSADAALRHVFFSETDEPVHTIVSSNYYEPITPPDNAVKKTPMTHSKILKDITPLDLLPIPQSPYQICPDWHTDHPVSRHGRLCSAIKDDNRLSSSRATHVDRFLHDTESVDNNAWLTQSRPIYSSHQKIHPVTDRPNSSHVWNKYNYAAHQQLRPSTPVVEHVSTINVIPSASTSSNKRYSNVPEEDTHRRSGHHLHHHHHHPHHNDYHHHRPPTTTATITTTNNNNNAATATSTTTNSNGGFSIDRIPHYGNQLVKWAPPHFPHQADGDHEMIEPKRPESRRCRTPAPFSSSIMKHKYTSSSINTSTNPSSIYSNASPIKPWTPASTTTTVNTEKIMADGYSRISDKPQSTHRNSTSHRFNLWVPNNDDQEDEDEEDYPNENNNRSVFLPLHSQ